MLTDLMNQHQPLLERALEVLRTREHWSPYLEDTEAYREQDAAAGERAFRGLLRLPFDLDQPGTDGVVGPAPETGGESSPYGFPLGISYPHGDPDVLLPAMRAAMAGWQAATPLERAVVCTEILARINARSHEFAHAAVHTSGHNPVMAFHAGAVHAQDRGLEAVALGLAEQTRLPAAFRWHKPLPDGSVFSLAKTFSHVPLGVSLLITGAVFPTWNGYPGLFASLVTGNAVLVKPHPRAVLPLALTVRIAREVLRETGFSPDLVCLAAERPGERLARRLALRPEVRIIDYTGNREFGDWLTGHARQAQVRVATSAVNSLLIESTADYRGMLDNLAFTLALYSGQLCTSPQNLLIPRGGIDTDEGRKSYREVVADLGAALDALLADDAGAAGVLGALYAPSVVERVDKAGAGLLGEVLHPSRAVTHPRHPGAVIRTPVVVGLDPDRPEQAATLLTEHLGPVYFAVAVDSAEAGTAWLGRAAREAGALSAGAWTTSAEVERALRETCADCGVTLSLNLSGGWYLTQSAIYSDLHGTGLNPSGNTTYGDPSFVTGRFRTVAVRRLTDTR